MVSSSREEEKKGQLAQSTNTSLTDKTPPFNPLNLPKKTRFLSELIFHGKKEIDQPRKSAHVVREAYKKNGKNPSKFSHFKENDPEENELISELEAVACAFCKTLAKQYVPTARPVFDDIKTFKYVAVASNNLPGFIPNRDDPLKDENFIIELPEIENERQRNILISTLEDLSKVLFRGANSSNWSLFQYARNKANEYRSAFTAVQAKKIFDNFLKEEDKYNPNTVKTLLENLELRKDHVKEVKDKDPAKYAVELQLLKIAIKSARYLKEHEPLPITDNTIYKLEKMDDIIQKKGIDLKKLDDSQILSERIEHNIFQIKVKDLKNFRIIKGLGTSLTTRYIFKEGDNHNRNMAKDGLIIDFDMTLLDILFKFRKGSLIDDYLREPTIRTFVVTANDIRRFPDVTDAKLYYWPTKQTFDSKSVRTIRDAISKVFDISQNLFTNRDNMVYKKLTNNSIFNFYKYKTLLQYILNDSFLYRYTAELFMRKKISYEIDGARFKLIDVIVKDQAARIDEIKKVLIKMPEFRQFLAQHGEHALKLIKKEMIEEKDRLAAKLDKEPRYKDVYSYYDERLKKDSSKNIDELYSQLFISCGAGMDEEPDTPLCARR